MKTKMIKPVDVIAKMFSISVEDLLLLYTNDNEVKLAIDEFLDDVNSRRIVNGEPIIKI